MIECPCAMKGWPVCGSCTPNERALAELERRLTPTLALGAAEEQPDGDAREEGADGQP